MAILVGIDGTGSEFAPGAARDRSYDAAFVNSFVRRICNSGPNALYQRGPVALGGGLLEAINAGLMHIKAKLNGGIPGPVLLTGYSRGAAGVVSMANRLKKKNINVQAMLLFDCVDRSGDIDAEVIPDNVAHVMHVIRDPRSRSRESFGNDGLKYHPGKTSYDGAYKFMCTHGAMGGTPWDPKGHSKNEFINEGFGAGFWDGSTKITYAQDAQVSQRVWQTVQPFISKHGFMG